MFSFSPTAVSILSAFGAIAVIWALALYALGRQGIISMGVPSFVKSAPSRVWRGKITSPSEKKQTFAIRENLLRLMMIFERPVVDYFSFLVKLSASRYRRLKLLPKLRLIFLQILNRFCPEFFGANTFLRFFNVKRSLTLKHNSFFQKRAAYAYVRNPRSRQI